MRDVLHWLRISQRIQYLITAMIFRFVLCCIDVKNVFLRFLLFFIKNAFFNVFYFWERFLFSRGDIFHPTKAAKILLNLPDFCIKRLFSDGNYNKILS